MYSCVDLLLGMLFTTKSNMKSLDFAVTRFPMKSLKPFNTEMTAECQRLFRILSPIVNTLKEKEIHL